MYRAGEESKVFFFNQSSVRCEFRWSLLKSETQRAPRALRKETSEAQNMPHEAKCFIQAWFIYEFALLHFLLLGCCLLSFAVKIYNSFLSLCPAFLPFHVCRFLLFLLFLFFFSSMLNIRNVQIHSKRYCARTEEKTFPKTKNKNSISKKLMELFISPSMSMYDSIYVFSA